MLSVAIVLTLWEQENDDVTKKQWMNVKMNVNDGGKKSKLNENGKESPPLMPWVLGTMRAAAFK